MYIHTHMLLLTIMHTHVYTHIRITQFDIIDFYPFVSKGLLDKVLSFARGITDTRVKDIDAIMLFNNYRSWSKPLNL